MHNSKGYVVEFIKKYQIQTSSADQLVLLKKYRKGGDFEARELLIRSNYAFICNIASRYVSRKVTFYDMFVCGVDGVCKAIEKYDLNHSVNFITYAVWHIKAKMLNKINQDAYGIITVPKRTLDENQKKNKSGRSDEVVHFEYMSNIIETSDGLVDIFETIAQTTYSSIEDELDNNKLLNYINNLIEELPKHKKESIKLKLATLGEITYESIVSTLGHGTECIHRNNYRKLLTTIQNNPIVVELINNQ